MSQKEVMEDLIKHGCIKSYKVQNVSACGEVGRRSDCRNTEQLELEFPDGRKLLVNTFCSGSSEDTFLIMQ